MKISGLDDRLDTMQPQNMSWLGFWCDIKAVNNTSRRWQYREM